MEEIRNSCTILIQKPTVRIQMGIILLWVLKKVHENAEWIYIRATERGVRTPMKNCPPPSQEGRIS
jgi:hypothetical protein